MKELLKEEYDDFINSYEENRSQGLRINILKVPIEEFLKKNPFTLKQIPWVSEGFYYNEDERPGRHPYHEAGLYYIQEPSAMAVGELVGARPGEKILDLCAAPGGKTTHIAGKMNQQGILLTNEIHPLRAKILSQNVERMGIKNAVVTNETPANLAEKFPNYFDRILVDAPCSGEGMFRKDPEACKEWSLENVKLCRERQLDILQHAANMLKPEGRIVYSTCTFSPEENEEVISEFLKKHLNFEMEDIKTYEKFDKGQKEWIKEAAKNIEDTIRIWPHKVQGEGHYIAILRKKDGRESNKVKYEERLTNKKLLNDYFEFGKEVLLDVPSGKYILFGDQLYIIPEDMISLENLRILRPGWHLGTMKKNRFEPSHALALSLNGKQVINKWNINRNSSEIISYLKGEAIEADGAKGWNLIQVDGYSIGWGKVSNNTLKNHYPKGLRWTGNIYLNK